MPSISGPKIDVYRVSRNSAGRVTGYTYLGSTNRYKCCKDAAEGFRGDFPRSGATAELIGRFDKKGN